MSHYYDGLTGSEFERKVLGRCLATFRGHLVRKEAFAQVRRNQPPLRTPTVARLICEMRQLVGDGVRFFTAVGTSLDVHQGIDGFFEFDGIIVTIDVTLNRSKVSYKADRIIQPEDLEDIPHLAGLIAQQMRTQLSGRV